MGCQPRSPPGGRHRDIVELRLLCGLSAQADLTGPMMSIPDRGHPGPVDARLQLRAGKPEDNLVPGPVDMATVPELNGTSSLPMSRP